MCSHSLGVHSALAPRRFALAVLTIAGLRHGLWGWPELPGDLALEGRYRH